MSIDTAATTRAIFAPDAPVLIHFGGAIGAKEGHVVEDLGGDTVDVRYPLAKGGESFKTVKAEKVIARPVATIDPPAVDDVPAVDIHADEEAPLSPEQFNELLAQLPEPVENTPAAPAEPIQVSDAFDDNPTAAHETAAPELPFGAKQNHQRATADHYFGDSANGAVYHADQGHGVLVVNDATRALKHIEAGLAAYDATTVPVPKIAVTSLKKRIAALIG